MWCAEESGNSALYADRLARVEIERTEVGHNIDCQHTSARDGSERTSQGSVR